MKLKNKSLKPNLYILLQVQTVNCARIVKSNILSSNGVIHLVDQVRYFKFLVVYKLLFQMTWVTCTYLFYFVCSLPIKTYCKMNVPGPGYRLLYALLHLIKCCYVMFTLTLIIKYLPNTYAPSL